MCLSGLLTINVRADEYADYTYNDFQTIYTETPVRSYYAYPDDPNFIPETEFMNQDNQRL